MTKVYVAKDKVVKDSFSNMSKEYVPVNLKPGDSHMINKFDEIYSGIIVYYGLLTNNYQKSMYIPVERVATWAVDRWDLTDTTIYFRVWNNKIESSPSSGANSTIFGYILVY